MICNRNIKGHLVWEADGNIGKEDVYNATAPFGSSAKWGK